MTDKISVIIITRNRAEMLSRALSSLIKQSYLPDEIIVVDNASTDNTKETILSFKKKLPIRYVYEEKIGIPYARNRGIKEASGSIIFMIDDDCEADKLWVEKMVKAHKKYPKAWVIQGRANSLPKNGLYSLLSEFNRFLSVLSHTGKKLPLESFFSQNFKEKIEFSSCDTRNFSIKSSYIKKHNLIFNEEFYIFRCGEDTDFGKQIIQKNGLILYCPDIKIYHWERSTLKEFLEQRFNRGRAAAKISHKWKGLLITPSLAKPGKFVAFLIFCKILNLWKYYPMLILLLLLDRIYYLNGRYYEKRIISFGKQ